MEQHILLGKTAVVTGASSGMGKAIVQRFVQEGANVVAVARRKERLDILINNAGIMDDMSPVGDVTDEKYRQVMDVNLYGPMTAMRKAVGVFPEQGTKGSIVNVVSEGALRTCAGAVYCASKAALASMTTNTAYMYMKDGIRVNGIAPGGSKTEIGSSMGVPNVNGYGRIQPVLACAPETGEAEDIANAALFLASDQSSYISGAILPVDGGWLAG